jgi:uncharacterized membrane protein
MPFEPPTKSQNQSAAIIIILISLLMICFAIFINAESMDHIRVNGELIKKSDPRFHHEVTVARLLMGFMGLLFLSVSSIFLWISSRPPKND